MSDETKLSQAQRHYDNRQEPGQECDHRWTWLGERDGRRFWKCGFCWKQEEQ